MWCTHHEVQGMLPNRSSENLEVKTLSYLIKPVLFSEHLSISISCIRLGHIVLVEVTVISHIGLLIANKKEALEWNSRASFLEAFL